MSKDKDQHDSVASGISSTSPRDSRASEEFDGIPDDLDFEPAVPVGKKSRWSIGIMVGASIRHPFHME